MLNLLDTSDPLHIFPILGLAIFAIVTLGAVVGLFALTMRGTRLCPGQRLSKGRYHVR